MFRFTIRDLLWLMVVVALGVGWWIDQTQKAEVVNKNAELRIHLQWALNEMENERGRGLGIQLRDGETIRSRNYDGPIWSAE